MVIAACGAGSGQAVADGTPDATLSDVAGCTACHTGPLAFTGRDPAEVAKLVSSIVDGAKAHPPLGLPATDTESIRSLAEALTAH